MHKDDEYYKESSSDDWYPFDTSDINEEEWESEEVEYRMMLELERRYFEELEGRGKNAHAYNHDYDNFVIIQMREDGKTLREIAEQFGCCPSTIRNRLKIMGIK